MPDIEFTWANGARIAYQVFGSGEQTVVAVPPSAQNIEIAWERPEIRSMLDRFGSFCRYVHFDKRGTGSSDRNVLVPGIDERVDDLLAVVDAAGVGRAHLFAQSEGGPVTLLFAATYPHRVASVTLVGSGARMVEDDLGEEALVEMVARQEHFVKCWGTPESFAVDVFAPSMAADADFRAWHVRYERLSASADSLRDLFAQMFDMDVRDLLPDVEAPVLSIARTEDGASSIEFSREVAELVPDGRFVELEGVDHFAYLGNVDAWMDEVERLVTGSVSERDVGQPPTGVRVETLGRFAVVADGREIPVSEWGSRRARTLLKRLVVARGWPVTRDELFDILWPDESDTRKMGARLSVLLSGVRKVLGGGVVADRQTIALDLDHVSSDVDRFLKTSDDALSVALYTGEFLPEDRYDDWSGALRDEARTHFVRAAQRQWAHAHESGQAGDAVDIARRLVEADPYNERFHRFLVTSLTGLGDRAGAESAGIAWVAQMEGIGIEADITDIPGIPDIPDI